MREKTNITRVITITAAALISVVVIIFPLDYFIDGYKYTVGSIEAEAEINARIITQIISANPDMWQFEQVRIEEYLSRRPRNGYAETRRVVNAENEVVAESADDLKSPVITRSVELYDSGAVVGRIEVSRSLRPILKRTGLIILVTTPLGVAAFLVLRLLPIRSLRRSEEALRKERDTAQTYLDVAGVILLALDADQKVTLINKKGCEVLGRAECDIVGKNWFDHFVPEPFRSEMKEYFPRFVEGDIERFAYFENPVLTSSGEERMIAWRNTVLVDESGRIEGTLSSGEDVTERKRLEDQLRQAQKMEAVGRLAGGVAHDFNNILTTIIGYGSLMQFDLDDGNPAKPYVEQILSSAERAARLTQSLLAFSRKQIINPKPVRLGVVAGKMEKLLAKIIGEDIELRTVCHDENATVWADSGQLEQILMNLAANARDAMPDGGVLTIETDRMELDGDFIKAHGYGKPGPYAVLSVTDTGAGMDEKTRTKIFEPFFTTKEVGKGTGLGLSIVYGIVKQNSGYVSVYSEPGRGTTFRIYLPAILMNIEEAGAAALTDAARGTETVLVAEDDADVRKLTKAVLEGAGYTVIEAVDGENVIRLFAEHKDEIELVLIDVIMPKANGKAVSEAIRKMRPRVKIIFTSGYTADIIHKKGILEEGAHFIAKPILPNALLDRVRKTLDKR